MKEGNTAENLPKLPLPAEHRINLPQVMSYPASEDIYNKSKEEENIDPENISKLKESNKKDPEGKKNQNNFSTDVSGNDLDVPGSELDDADENIGSEDEENNYYSLGGDEHSDLDENKDE